MTSFQIRPPWRLAGGAQAGMTLRALTLLITGLSTCLCVRAQDPAALPASLRGLFTQGVEAQKEGRLDEAEKCYTEVLSRGGRASIVYNNLGIVYQVRREHERAIKQFQEAIRLQPKYVAPRILLGSSLISLGRLPEAMRQLEKAVSLEPKDLLARQQLARAYERSGNFGGLVEQYRTLRRLKPAEPEFAYQLGNAYLKLSGWCHREIVSQNPDSTRVFQTLAENHRVQGHPSVAARYYRRAIQADPNMPENHLALAILYLEQGKLPDARREVDAELAIVPYSAFAIELKKKLETPAAVTREQ